MSLTILSVAYPFAPVSRDTAGGAEQILAHLDAALVHAGHRSLIRMARSVADVVVVSIFVNPLQFGPDEDYARYPRMLEDDLVVCEQEGVDVVFAPSVAELYPSGRQVTLCSGQLGGVLEGRSRPGHYDGVLTIMSKLLNLLRPDMAILGQKDPQQLAVVRKMAADLNWDVDIVAAPAVRDNDGLLLSPRNRYLLPHERTTALALPRALAAAADHHSVEAALAAARRVLEQAERDGGLQLDYVALVNPQTFAALPPEYEGDALLLVAARVDSTRLIDHAELNLVRPKPEPQCVDRHAEPASIGH